ncbi:MAG: alpha/beta fold hydrolase [Alphaproteobacteria bacterium]|nr:alpha/beta fold hydrolase [Alphaproteobacteria bacterium]
MMNWIVLAGAAVSLLTAHQETTDAAVETQAAPVGAQEAVFETEPDPAARLQTTDTRLTPLVCPFRGEIDYEPGEVSCGMITVPENRERAGSRLIQLHYVRISPTGEDEAEHRDDPVIYLTGGPGVGVDAYVGRLKDHPIAQTRALYILEQRGIGASTSFCPQFNTIDPGLNAARNLDEMMIASAERNALCFREAAEQGIDLSGYNTVENARDVRALREALGYEQWNVWGISYGSHLGQMLLRQDPGGVRALVLDAIVPNDLHDLFDMSRIFDVLVANFTGDCDGARACEDLEARLFAAMESLRDDPVMLAAADPELAPGGETWLPPALLAYMPFSLAYEQETYAFIPALMSNMADALTQRDPVVLDGLAVALSGGMGPGGGMTMSPGMSAAVQCNDGYVQAELAAAEASAGSRWHGLVVSVAGSQRAAQVCEEAGLTPRDRADYALVQTDVPTLIVNGAWDPITPPWLAVYIHEAMPGSRYVEVPYAGHGPTRSMPECGGQVMREFFDNRDLAGLDAACLEAGAGAPQYEDLMWTTGIYRALALSPDAPKAFIAPMAWVGVSGLILLLGVIMLPMAVLARIIDRRPAAELAALTGGARLAAWLAGVSGLAGLALVGAGAARLIEDAEAAILAGLAAPAGAGSWLLLLTGLLGLGSLILLARTLASGERVRFGTLAGITLMGLAAAALTTFAFVWDIGPF